MTGPQRRPIQQEADLKQNNDQQVEQSNTQDASHHSHVQVTVQNQIAAPVPAWAPGQLAGRVLDAGGIGVDDCVVEVYFGPLIGVPVAVEETDRLGHFRVPDLPPGFYSLRAVAPDGTTAQLWNLRLNAGDESRMQICLPLVCTPTRGRVAFEQSHR